MTDALLSHAIAPKSDYLKPEVELRLLEKYKVTGCPASLNRIILNYSNLCMHFAQRYRTRFEMEDTYQDAMEFLILTVKRFDPSYGVPFFTFATREIGHLMSHRAIRKWASVTTPGTKSFYKAFRAMPRQRDSQMTYEKAKTLATELDVKLEDIYTAHAIYRDSTQSLNAVLKGSDLELIDTLIDDSDPAEMVIKFDFDTKQKADAQRRMARLSEREKLVIQWRRMSDEPRTLQEVGVECGVSAERIRQIEAKAMVKLQAAA